MSGHGIGREYAGNPPENYQQYFVPAIGAPIAHDLIGVAELHPSDRVLDVACGTGVVARLASEAVGKDGVVAGLDVNPGMLAVAREASPAEMNITWHEANAESMPFPDASFDAVLCQMGLQFMPDKGAALSEMRRVLAPGGRLLVNLPGPTPPAFVILAEALAANIAPQAASFVYQVFSLHDTAEIQSILNTAAFQDITVEAQEKALSLPAPEDFLWQYVFSTPLAALAGTTEDERLASIEHDVVKKSQPFVQDHSMAIHVRMVTATARAA